METTLFGYNTNVIPLNLLLLLSVLEKLLAVGITKRPGLGRELRATETPNVKTNTHM